MSLAIRNEISNSIFYDTLNLFYAHRTKGGEEARVLRVTVLVLNYGNDQIFESIFEHSRGTALLRCVDRRWRSEKIEGFKKFEIKKKFMKHKTRKLGNIIDIYKFRISFQFSNSVGPWLNFGRKINSKIYCTFLNRENRGTTIFKQIILAFQFLEIHTQLNFERRCSLNNRPISLSLSRNQSDHS